MLGLTLITIGIYFFFWWYYINREMHDLGKARGVDLGQKPGNSVLAVTIGWIIIVPAIVTEWTTSGRIQRSQETVGIDRPASGPVIFILLFLISPVGLWYMQSELNKVWRGTAGRRRRAGEHSGARRTSRCRPRRPARRCPARSA